MLHPLCKIKMGGGHRNCPTHLCAFRTEESQTSENKSFVTQAAAPLSASMPTPSATMPTTGRTQPEGLGTACTQAFASTGQVPDATQPSDGLAFLARSSSNRRGGQWWTGVAFSAACLTTLALTLALALSVDASDDRLQLEVGSRMFDRALRVRVNAND